MKARSTAPVRNGKGKTQQRTVRVKAMPVKKAKVQSRSKVTSRSAAAASSVSRTSPSNSRLSRPSKPRIHNSISVARAASRSPAVFSRSLEVSKRTHEERTRRVTLPVGKVDALNSTASKGKERSRNDRDTDSAPEAADRPRRVKNVPRLL
jgi:hypothetical protein